MLIFYKQQSYFSQIVSKKAKITILFFMKNSKNNNIIFVISIIIQYFAYLSKGKGKKNQFAIAMDLLVDYALKLRELKDTE